MPARDCHLRAWSTNADLLLRITADLSARRLEHGWEMLPVAHRGILPRTASARGIDGVLHKYVGCVVLACPQVRATQWVFGTTEVPPQTVEEARLCMLTRQSGQQPMLDSASFLVAPATPESGGCIMRGNTRDPATLAQLASVLVQSIERCAREASGQTVWECDTVLAVYIPVLVTTAELWCCQVERGPMRREDGQVPAETPGAPVAIMRFRLDTRGQHCSGTPAADRHHAYHHTARTVFVVHATALVPFLQDLFLI